MADKILTVVRNDDLRQGLITMGKERIKGFRWDNVAQRLIEIFKEVKSR
ncbi:MAG: hypothetical protein HY880_04425 [Deltaproteobacteria bacterium]|nr:hypothetical protein [Deltaproteobacteria bacterium]